MAFLYPASFHFSPLAAALSAELAAQMTASPAMEQTGDGWLVKMSVPGLSSKVSIINLLFYQLLARLSQRFFHFPALARAFSTAHASRGKPPAAH